MLNGRVGILERISCKTRHARTSSAVLDFDHHSSIIQWMSLPIIGIGSLLETELG